MSLMFNSVKNALILQLIIYYIFVGKTHRFNGLQPISTYYPDWDQSQLHVTRMLYIIKAEWLVHRFISTKFYKY